MVSWYNVAMTPCRHSPQNLRTDGATRLQQAFFLSKRNSTHNKLTRVSFFHDPTANGNALSCRICPGRRQGTYKTKLKLRRPRASPNFTCFETFAWHFPTWSAQSWPGLASRPPPEPPRLAGPASGPAWLAYPGSAGLDWPSLFRPGLSS